MAQSEKQGYNPPLDNEEDTIPDPIPDPYGGKEEAEERLLYVFRRVLDFLYLYGINVCPDTGITNCSGVELEWDLFDEHEAHIVVDFIPDLDPGKCRMQYAVIKTGENDGGYVNSMDELVTELESCGVWKLISNKEIKL